MTIIQVYLLNTLVGGNPACYSASPSHYRGPRHRFIEWKLYIHNVITFTYIYIYSSVKKLSIKISIFNVLYRYAAYYRSVNIICGARCDICIICCRIYYTERHVNSSQRCTSALFFLTKIWHSNTVIMREAWTTFPLPHATHTQYARHVYLCN